MDTNGMAEALATTVLPVLILAVMGVVVTVKVPGAIMGMGFRVGRAVTVEDMVVGKMMEVGSGTGSILRRAQIPRRASRRNQSRTARRMIMGRTAQV